MAGFGFVKGTSHLFLKQTNKQKPKATQKGVGRKNTINQQLKGTGERVGLGGSAGNPRNRINDDSMVNNKQARAPSAVRNEISPLLQDAPLQS